LRLSTTPRSGWLFQRAAIFVVGCLGLTWGILAFPGSEMAFLDLEGRLLNFETFSPTIAVRTLESESQRLNTCDTHSQRAMLLLEIPLADATLRSGAATEYDRHIQALESRSRQILTCTPRDSFVWLLAFDLEVMHGLLNERSFDLLAMSYETSPNEAWITVRRIFVAMPLLLNAPESLRETILHEFRQLVYDGFVDEATRVYLAARPAIRALLQTRIEQLDLRRQKTFSEALQKAGSLPAFRKAHALDRDAMK
jgi:hypothetical protein